MKPSPLFPLITAVLLSGPAVCDDGATRVFRPPAVPLVACDPYFSIWSQADHLWETTTTHWTGKDHPMAAMIRIGERVYRLMGAGPQTIAAMPQVSVHVRPTQTIYVFEADRSRVTLTFTTPSLPYDMDIISRPTTYLDCAVESLGDAPSGAGSANGAGSTSGAGSMPEIEFYFDAGGQLSTDVPEQKVVGEEPSIDGLRVLKVGSETQRILGHVGDDIRIDWGYFYVASKDSPTTFAGFGDRDTMRDQFRLGGIGSLQPANVSFPTPAGDVVAVMAMTLQRGRDQVARGTTLLAYDDLYSIEFMKQRLRPYWRKDGWEADDLLVVAMDEHADLIRQCETFDTELMTDLVAAGGQKYADIAALSYRQCLAAGKFVADENGQPLQFCKENHSNGCIATSDVFYPMMPQFFLFGPTMTKSVLVPFMEYARSDRWKFPFAPHDLGTYPKANGQRYGGGETSLDGQMPVEESGNMLILFAALAQMEGNADFADEYWPQLRQWAAYLQEKGFDPENQLCTDDFAGHMAHNVNLSAKAICGLGAYAKLCRMLGKDAEADQYQAIAQAFAKQWVDAAGEEQQTRLAFDQAGTWSQKYNLVWDKLLGLGLFPDAVVKKEMAFYRAIQNEYGLPLDSRSDYTKLDWILWTATLTRDRDDFDALVAPVHRFISATPQRTPLTDWYFTSTAQKRGFDARPVVGAVFLELLYNPDVWTKYASRDITRADGWAPMPTLPEFVAIVPTSESEGQPYRFVIEPPADDAAGRDWKAEDYDDENWQSGLGGLGRTDGIIRTPWNTGDIWVRRNFTIDGPVPDRVALKIWHDEDADIYLNGKPWLSLGGYTTGYELIEVNAKWLRSGDNTIAIHCRQTRGGQYIDFGISKLVM